MLLHLFALDHRLFVPVDPEPAQTFENVLGVFGFGPFFVGVFNSQQEGALLTASKQPVEHGCASRADVKRARGAGARRTRTIAFSGGGNGTDGIRTRNFRRDRAVL